MPLINSEINLDLKWYKKSVILATNVGHETTFSITDTKLYVPVVTLSTQDNAKLLEQLKSVFKRIINWNKFQSKLLTIFNQYLDYLLDPGFQGVNTIFVLSVDDEAQRTSYKRCYLQTVEIKNYNVITDEQNFFDLPVRNNFIAYDNI